MKTTLKSTLFALALLLMASCGPLSKLSGTKEQKLKITTTEGDIVVKLYNETPLHRDNFLRLVKAKIYDGVIFHRVIEDFMIQGGDLATRTEEQKSKNKNPVPEYTLPAEIQTPALYHKKGALAAARLGDNVNPMKNSSGYQFYIVKGKKFTDAELDVMQRSQIARYQRVDEAAADSTYKFSNKARADYRTSGGTPHLDGNYTVFGEVVKGLDVVDKISGVETELADRPKKEVRIIKIRKTR